MTFILAFSIGVQNSHKLLTGAERHSIAMIPNLKLSYSSNTFTKKITCVPVAKYLIFKTILY
jgi:hypothetical protein